MLTNNEGELLEDFLKWIRTRFSYGFGRYYDHETGEDSLYESDVVLLYKEHLEKQ